MRRRSGAVLLEAMVALAVLGAIASTAAWQTAELLNAVSRIRTAEENIRAAQRLLTAVSLWPREDLDRHLGNGPQGPWMMYVERVGDDIYEVVLRDTVSERPVLRTALLREPGR